MTSPQPERPPLDRDSLKHAPGLSSFSQDSAKQACTVTTLDIPVSSSDALKSVPAFLHLPQNYTREQSENREKTAAILLSGASGGVVGPSSIYLSIADKLASLSRGIPCMRLDYRYPARNEHCVPDVLAAMNYLQNRFAISRFVLVGWSYGGAPVFTVGGQDDRVVGCATIASQTAQTEGIREVARRNVPVILLHGRNDRRLGASCSESLHEKYKKTTQGGHSELHLLDGDDHSLTKDPLKAENLLCGFIMKQAGEEIGRKEQEDVVQKALITDEQRKDRMEKGRDLLSESIE